MLKKLPLFYFPPTICWVDDSQLFLDAAQELFNRSYRCLSFADPEQALKYLVSYQPPSSKINFTRELTESDAFDVNNYLPININIAKITQLADISVMKDEIAVLIIDNNMPNLSGIEMCHKMVDASYKKILLTGQTGPIEVIDAFNNGLIDKFITKDQQVADKLEKIIHELTLQYFYEKTKNLLSHFETTHPSPLSDEIFISFFYNWLNKNNYKEFYLINKHGSFLVKDIKGVSAYFIVMSEYSKNEFIKLNDDAFDKAGHLLKLLSNGEAIPFFGVNKDSWNYSISDWDEHFYPSNVIFGREKYYWAAIEAKGE